jgi:CO/xanthine dehydrogenase FAD-binding subunit
MALWTHYHVPHTVEEALGLLAHYQGAARVVAGGTDLLLEMRQGDRPAVEALVDITRIPELMRLERAGEWIVIGAGVTHAQIASSSLLIEKATCLAESCGVVGGPQVRNVATLGGNVVNALPAADGTTSLMVLDAEAEVWQGGEHRWVALPDLFTSPGKSLIDPTCDLLLAFRFRPCEALEATAFKRIMRPQGVALPIMACAVWVRLGSDRSTLEDVRICIGPVAPRPARASEVEEVLRGGRFEEKLLDRAVKVARDRLHPRASKYRATAEYRVEMIEVLLRRTIPLAVQRARSGEVILEDASE